MGQPRFDEFSHLLTEARNPKTRDIDTLSVPEILALINDEDRKVPEIVARELKSIARAVELYVGTLRSGGRVFYVGAGTSGRLGVLDAAELPPTFGTSPRRVQGIIAGGYRALRIAAEGAEDSYELGQRDLEKRRVCSSDLVVGLAACKRTPYVRGALDYARRIGASTVLITAVPRSQVDVPVNVVISLPVGPEVIMGSTRMKAGTAQKLVLNMISTAAMIRLGKVYENMMVDLRATSEKLSARSQRTVMMATGLDHRSAKDLLSRSGGSVKVAIVCGLTGVSPSRARRLLREARGHVREALRLTKVKR